MVICQNKLNITCVLRLLKNVFSIFLNGVCVYWLQSKRLKYLLLSLLGKKAAHKHLCSTVGGYGINPSPKMGTYIHGFLSIFAQTLLELKCVGSPHKKSSIPRRQSLSSPISNPRDMSNKTTFSPASIKHFRSALHMTPVVTSHQPVTVNGAVNTDLLLSGQGIEEGTGSLLNCLLLP